MNDSPVLFVSSYADPSPTGHNANVPAQALCLRRLGWPVEILTWPREHTWEGPRPDASSPLLEGMPSLDVVRSGIPYRVVSLPNIWSERVLTETEWAAAVAWGVRALRRLRPQLVHVQFWQNLWWMLESANQLGIPTAYTAHDFGLGCQRTTLLTGWNTFCDGRVSVEVCSRCVLAGRGLLGRANETVTRLPLGELMLTQLFGSDGRGALARAGGVRIPVGRRVESTMTRLQSILPRIGSLIVTSRFGGHFFEQFGAPPNRIHVLPWFHTQQATLESIPPVHDVLRLGVATRIAPEKGLEVLFDALQKITTTLRVEVHIAGSIIDDYGRRLQQRFRERVGKGFVYWHGWIPNHELIDFYRPIHVAVVPTTAHETGPISLIEARAHGRPAICTETPSIGELLTDGVNGLTFPLGDSMALAERIDRLASSPELLGRLAAAPRRVLSASDYASSLGEIYRSLLQETTGEEWRSSRH